MAYANEKCVVCGRTLANSKYIAKEGSKCPICVLGMAEGSQGKYWETSQTPKQEGFRYPDDTSKYDDKWDTVKKKWVNLDGSEKPAPPVQEEI